MIHDYCSGGLVFHQGRLVVLQRYNGVWLFPKGHIDPGETAAEAAIREVREECGLEARILAELGETSYTFEEKGREHLKSVTWYLMESTTGEIILEPGFFINSRLITNEDINILTFLHDRELAVKAFGIYQEKVN